MKPSSRPEKSRPIYDYPTPIWTGNDFEGLSKIPSQMQVLRQTYDVRSNLRYQDTIPKTVKNYKEQINGGYGNFSKSQYTGSSSTAFDLANSAVYDRNYKKDDPVASYSRTIRSPVK